MAFQRVPNTAEFRAVYATTAGPDEYINTYYVRDTVSVRNLAYFTTEADAIRDALVANWVPNISNLYELNRIDWRDLNTEFGLSGTLLDGTNGASAQQANPAQVALLVKLTGDAGAAPRQGRLFLPGTTEDQIDGADSLFSTAIAAAAVTSENAVTTAIQTVVTSARVIVSRYLNNALRAEAVTNTLAGVSARRLAGSQRDRRPGVGS